MGKIMLKKQVCGMSKEKSFEGEDELSDASDELDLFDEDDVTLEQIAEQIADLKTLVIDGFEEFSGWREETDLQLRNMTHLVRNAFEADVTPIAASRQEVAQLREEVDDLKVAVDRILRQLIPALREKLKGELPVSLRKAFRRKERD